MTDIYGDGYLHVTNVVAGRATKIGSNSYRIAIDANTKYIRLLQSFFPRYFEQKYINNEDKTAMIVNPYWNPTKKILVKIVGCSGRGPYDLMIYQEEQYSGNESPLLQIKDGTGELQFYFYNQFMEQLTPEELQTFYLTFATYK